MAKASVFINNRSQAARLPAEVRFPDSVKKVNVRAVGQMRIISPINETWDSFFQADPLLKPSDDFMLERASQTQAERDKLE